MKHKGTETLQTQRFILRQFKVEDATQMFNNYCNDSEVTKFLTWNNHGNVQNTEEFLKDRVANYKNLDFYSWAIVDKQTGEVVGDITISNNEKVKEKAVIGWVIAKSYWNKGCMTECVKEVLNFLKQIGFRRIESNHLLENGASGKVMLKVGFEFECISKNFTYDNQGQLRDVANYSIVW